MLRRTPRGRELAWELDIPAELAVEADAQDLAEILGNLAENAAQWARNRVRVAARRSEDAADAGLVALAIEDDGPGIPQEAAETALSRGGWLDATKPGTGLGLAIVADLAEAYGGSLVLRRSRHLGSLCAEVRSRPARRRAARRGNRRRHSRRSAPTAPASSR